MKIIYFYEELMGYTLATIKEIAKRDIEVHVIHWNHKKLSKFKLNSIDNVFFYNRSEYDYQKIIKLLNNFNPELIVIGGWRDRTYMAIAKLMRAKNINVILALDVHWKGSLKQLFATFLAKIGYFKNYFSHVWIAGFYQFEYARRLGFTKQNIIHDLYSADTELFHKSYENSKVLKKQKYPHQFLFVGRFEPIKGLNCLLKAWESISDNRRDWELVLIGDGSLQDNIKSINGIKVKSFMQPDSLIKEIDNAGCFILPSHDEPWGVVVHEFAAAGLPLVLSNSVGASSTFLIPGLNGFNFVPGDTNQLVSVLKKVINTQDEDLIRMSNYSYQLSKRITPLSSASNLLSLISFGNNK